MPRWTPNRNYQSPEYRYGFQGQVKDDEIKGSGNSYNFGARFYDNRVGRWLSLDNVVKPWLSPYQFASGNPVNHIDPDGNDEIHFFYYISKFLDKEGKTQYQLTLSAEIIENNKEHTFYMHSPEGEVTQFHPFKSDRTPSSTKEAYKAGLPLSKGINFLGFFENGVDDNAYLGTLLQAAPEVMEHYSDVREDGMRFRSAVNRASSVDFYEKLLRAEELVYGIVDGYYLVKGLSKFAVKEISKASLKIAKPSFATIEGIIAAKGGSSLKSFSQLDDLAGAFKGRTLSNSKRDLLKSGWKKLEGNWGSRTVFEKTIGKKKYYAQWETNAVHSVNNQPVSYWKITYGKINATSKNTIRVSTSPNFINK